MSRNKKYDIGAVESRWQREWEKAKLYFPSVEKAKKPFYNLWMFPYPSAEGLHAGHAFSSTGSDIYGRFMRMQGKDVFQPIGYDSFGIHSENFALKIGEHPQTMLARTIKNYERQLRSLGHGYDWTRTVTTSEPDYYKWTQWLFIELFKAGLSYRAKASVNWCPSCKTVLADEQVVSGSCERCQTVVETRELEQWFFRITEYGERLLANLDKIDWPERIKAAQRNWIGKSEGMLVEFKIDGSDAEIEVFTTRPDTLNAVTFLATSKLYQEGEREKAGRFSGKYAIDPLSGRKLPIWDTNYVAPDYGTGVIMGVPAHDERDMEFAKKYGLDIVKKEPDKSLWQKIEKEGWGKPHI
ncbi:MAG: Leucine-tRNA ligase, partial [Candidatus Woesebacteria bacterium GW2011_GWE1_45_18]